jgi:hypothetical protein
MKLEFPGAVPEVPVRDINEAAAYCSRQAARNLDSNRHNSDAGWRIYTDDMRLG